MSAHEEHDDRETRQRGCDCCHPSAASPGGLSRRGFLGGLGGAAALGGLAFASASTVKAAPEAPMPKTDLRTGKPLRVQPALVYSLPQRREATSWRPYGGLQTPGDVDTEAARIKAELKGLVASADFALEVLPLVRVANDAGVAAAKASDADVILVFAAGGHQGWLETLAASGKPNLMFLRHKSGPIYLWYEIAHWRFLRKSEDDFAEPNMDVHDIVVDDYGEVLWRLRSLYGLKNTLGTKVIALGGLQAYSRPGQECGPPHAKEVWKFDIKPVGYEELAERLKKTRADETAFREVQQEADALLAQEGVTLDTEKRFVVNSFLARRVFRAIMDEAGATSIGVGNCMGSLIRITDTPPCLVLSLLNDEGLTAFCHCDFTHTPPGILLRHISGKPSFVSNSHFPYNGVLTLAHCAAPRKMNGKDYEPTKIMTHFESDYGAATKVRYTKGQIVTVIIPNLRCSKWQGFRGKVLDSPSHPACRSQIDIAIDGDFRKLLTDMQGFHAQVCYGDYLREVGYSLKKVGSIEWQNFSEPA